MSAKKTPMRMCTGCREMKPKQQLIRIVKTPDGEIKLDTTGRLNGRGAYICKSADCLKKRRRRALCRARLRPMWQTRYTPLLKGSF